MPFSTPLISIRSLLVLGLTAIECWIPHANAANYSLWVHGRSSTAIMGNYQDFSYWGPKTTSAGVNKRAVNWDGKSPAILNLTFHPVFGLAGGIGSKLCSMNAISASQLSKHR